MAMLLLRGLQMFCGLPGRQIIGPTLAAVLPISLPNWLSWLGWTLGLRFTKNAKLTALVQKDGKLSYKKLFLWGFILGSASVWPIYFLLMFFACRAV